MSSMQSLWISGGSRGYGGSPTIGRHSGGFRGQGPHGSECGRKKLGVGGDRGHARPQEVQGDSWLKMESRRQVPHGLTYEVI